MPYLELELIQDGMYDENKPVDQLQNAVATFSMTNTKCGTKSIICKPIEIVEDCNECTNCFPKYHLVYKFMPRDTRKKGRYEGTIEIDFLDGCGKLIVPIHEKLYINVI